MRLKLMINHLKRKNQNSMMVGLGFQQICPTHEIYKSNLSSKEDINKEFEVLFKAKNSSLCQENKNILL